MEMLLSLASYWPTGFVIYEGEEGHVSYGQLRRRCQWRWMGYPEVNVEIPSAAKLPVTDLEGDSHLVLLVEVLVEAFPAVGRELDVMGRGSLEEAGCQQQRGGCT